MAALPRYADFDRSARAAHVTEPLGDLIEALTATGDFAGLPLARKLAATVLAATGDPAVLHALAINATHTSAALDLLDEADEAVDAWERRLDEGSAIPEDLLESAQGHLVALRDVLWTIRHDRVGSLARVAGLGFQPGDEVSQIISYLAIDTVLAGIDRLEVRGRDSAGIQVWIALADDDRSKVRAALGADVVGDEYRSGGARIVDGGVAFVYKRAAILGALGDNVATLRTEIAADTRLQTALRLPSARASVLAHTRWASVGRISESNAHPVDSRLTGVDGTFVAAVLNGDIDNHVGLRRKLSIPDSDITTDAKLIPAMVAREIEAGRPLDAALAGCVNLFDGSMAIATQADPDRIGLAVKGSGQGLYVGLAPWCLLVASEVYGLVAWTDRFIRLDGSTADGATVVVLDRHKRDVDTLVPHGHRDPLAERTAEITTRDVARGDFDHYLAKEITGAPESVRKSLRGRIANVDGHLSVSLGTTALPQRIRDALAGGRIRQLLLIGQGTAAVACQGIAAVIEPLLTGLRVRALPATELSAGEMPADMTDTCVIAVSQSGTTTDTNRTVDMVRQRGAAVLAIVNRRDSDLGHKCDGVLYTSDGRDIEMAVASTKAFYSQVATGILLGLQIGVTTGAVSDRQQQDLLAAMLHLPADLEAVHALDPQIASAATAATLTPSWSVVGSGLNRVAAAEVRIKLSELCYRTVSTDALEDKKHVDLSAEAMILVCAAGTPPQQIRDMAKEIEIFAAHRNVPIVIVDAELNIPWASQHVIQVPRTHPALAWLLSTAVGHVFAYHAARAIDALAEPLRAGLASLEHAIDAGATRLSELQAVRGSLDEFLGAVAGQRLRGSLTSEVTLGLANALLLIGSSGATLPIATGTTDEPIQYVRDQFTAGIEELTRSIDSVKHQAKTVTVGTSRGDTDLLDNLLTQWLAQAGSDPTLLSYRVLIGLKSHACLVEQVLGATRYRIDRQGATTTIQALRKIGSTQALASRADQRTTLVGSKRYAVESGAIRLVRGDRDGRLVLLVPEQSGGRPSGLTLLHLQLAETAETACLLAALESSGSRLAEIEAAVTERDVAFDPAALTRVPVELALIGPIPDVTALLLG